MAEGTVRHWDDDTLDYFALCSGKNYFFSADGHSPMDHLCVRGTAMVAADPIGRPGNTRRTLDEFLAFRLGDSTAFASSASATPTSPTRGDDLAGRVRPPVAAHRPAAPLTRVRRRGKSHL